jgi:hypothetical protein
MTAIAGPTAALQTDNAATDTSTYLSASPWDVFSAPPVTDAADSAIRRAAAEAALAAASKAAPLAQSDETRRRDRERRHREVEARRAAAAVARLEEAARADFAAEAAAVTEEASAAAELAAAAAEAAVERARDNSLDFRARAHYNLRLLRGSFAGIEAHSERARRRWRKAIAFARLRLCSAAFAAWSRHCAAAAGGDKEKHARAATFAAQRVARRALAALRASISALRDKETRATAWARRRCAGRAIDAWRLGAAAVTGARAVLLTEVEGRFCRAILRRALFSWATALPRLREERSTEARREAMLARARALLDAE